jgi:hypothetical protein
MPDSTSPSAKLLLLEAFTRPMPPPDMGLPASKGPLHTTVKKSNGNKTHCSCTHQAHSKAQKLCIQIMTKLFMYVQLVKSLHVTQAWNAAVVQWCGGFLHSKRVTLQACTHCLSSARTGSMNSHKV